MLVSNIPKVVVFSTKCSQWKEQPGSLCFCTIDVNIYFSGILLLQHGAVGYLRQRIEILKRAYSLIVFQYQDIYRSDPAASLVLEAKLRISVPQNKMLATTTLKLSVNI